MSKTKEVFEEDGVKKEEKAQKPKRLLKILTTGGLITAAIAGGLGIVILGGLVVAPESTEEVVMGVVTEAKKVVHEVVPVSEPVIVLGRDGGERDLDSCDGTWIKQISYQEVLDIPAYSAHNGCGGAVILEKNVGDTVKVRERSGEVNLYVVKEAFSKPSNGLKIYDLREHGGVLLLQTCNWRVGSLRFITLEGLASEERG